MEPPFLARIRSGLKRDWSRVGGLSWILVIYLLGVTLRVLRQGVGFSRTLAFLRRCRDVGDDEIRGLWKRIASSSRLYRSIRLVESDEIEAPLCWAGSRPVVVVPSDRDEKEGGSIEWALRHELVHLERRDSLVIALQVMATTLFWPHPIIWWLCRQVDLLRELSCDQAVIHRTGKSKSYALALMEYAARATEARGRGRRVALVNGIHWYRTSTQLRRRIEMLEHNGRRQSFVRRIGGGLTLAVLLGSLFAANMSLASSFIIEPTGATAPKKSSYKSGVAEGSRGEASGDFDPDTDGDGLSDLQETHKYFTDPKRRDSDGDGVEDGDWNERREYTYTLRSIVQVLAPYNKDALQDDYQDARVLEEPEGYVELEVIHYPLNTWEDAIEENSNWREDYRHMTESLEPGVTTNWDEAMREDLLQDLGADGIEVGSLTDKEVVEKVSAWILERNPGLDMFTTYSVHYPNGGAEVHPQKEDKFHRSKGDPSWSVEEQLQRDVYGKGMYYHRTRGTCTSSANLLTTVLRCVGIPTRMVLAIPVIDASDESEIELVRSRLTHHGVRKIVSEGVAPLRNAFAAHTFNEVYVGHRWHRLNYSRLGQNILDRNLFGLITHVHTFDDLSEADLISWGTRKRDAVFAHNNPYSTVTLSDQIGVHAKIPNPVSEPTKEHRTLTISKAYWMHTDEAPQWIGVASFPLDGSGHVLVHVDEYFEGEGLRQYGKFYDHVDKEFVLRARGKPELKANARRGFWAREQDGSREFYLQIDPGDFEKMVPGARYSLHPRNGDENHQWRVKSGVTLVLPKKLASKRGENRQHRELTISSAYWLHSKHRAEWISAASFPQDGTGHVLVHVDELIPGAGLEQYEAFYSGVGKRFVLQAKGVPDVNLRAERGYWVKDEIHSREFYLKIDRGEFIKMKPGVSYRLAPVRSSGRYRWSVRSRVRLVRPEGDLEKKRSGFSEARRGEEGEASPGSSGETRIHESLTVESAYWAHGSDAPQDFTESFDSRVYRGLFLHVKENFPEQDGDQYMHFARNVDSEFRLEAEGREPIEVSAAQGCVASRDGLREIPIFMTLDRFHQIVPAVEYRLVPLNRRSEYQWIVDEGLRVTRD